MEMKQLMVAAESVHVWSDDDEWVKSLVCVCVCVWVYVCVVVCVSCCTEYSCSSANSTYHV